MYGAILGDLIGFPYEYKQEDLTDREIPLLESLSGVEAAGPDRAGELFSEKTVLTAALQEGLLRFEKKIPEILSAGGKAKNADSPAGQNSTSEGKEPGKAAGQEVSVSRNVFEQTAASEMAASMRRFGTAFPLAGYGMEMSIWLFRDGTDPAQNEDPGPAARVSPVAWLFQEDLYMMRRMAVLQALLTNRNRETLKAADAAACMVFLALHKCTKDYIAGYLDREFGFRVSSIEEMKTEILYADYTGGPSGSGDLSAADHSGTDDNGHIVSSASAGRMSLPALCLRAALTAFLHGKDYEDVLRLAVSLCGSRIDTAAVASIAGAAAEAFFGIPDGLREQCRAAVPEQIRTAADAFSRRVDEKKRARELSPALKARWETALSRASENHPAAVQGNEPLERAIEKMLKNRDRESLIAGLEILRLRAVDKGRVYVPVAGVRRPDRTDGSAVIDGNGSAGNSAGKAGAAGETGGMIYRMKTVRTDDGRLWQPAFTSREQLEKAGAAKEMLLSYSISALLKRFVPGQAEQPVPEEIAGIVLNPGGTVFFIPRVTIASVVEKI